MRCTVARFIPLLDALFRIHLRFFVWIGWPAIILLSIRFRYSIFSQSHFCLLWYRSTCFPMRLLSVDWPYFASRHRNSAWFSSQCKLFHDFACGCTIAGARSDSGSSWRHRQRDSLRQCFQPIHNDSISTNCCRHGPKQFGSCATNWKCQCRQSKYWVCTLNESFLFVGFNFFYDWMSCFISVVWLSCLIRLLHHNGLA